MNKLSKEKINKRMAGVVLAGVLLLKTAVGVSADEKKRNCGANCRKS